MEQRIITQWVAKEINTPYSYIQMSLRVFKTLHLRRRKRYEEEEKQNEQV